MAEIEHGPFAVMAGAPWNVLDSRGARIALCGGDSNADWEKYGPPIAPISVDLIYKDGRNRSTDCRSAIEQSDRPAALLTRKPFGDRLRGARPVRRFSCA